MYMYMYMCIYMYMYMHIYIYIYIYTCISIYTWQPGPRALRNTAQPPWWCRGSGSPNRCFCSMSFSVVSSGWRFAEFFLTYGWHLGGFGDTFCDILEVCELLLDATPSAAETYISRFWSSRVGTYALTFPGLESQCVFYRF